MRLKKMIKNKDEFIRIIKYVFSAGLSFVFDLLLFHMFNNLFLANFKLKIILSTIIARIISSLYNYFINAKFVFENNNKSSFFKYYVLVIIQMFVSAFSVYLISCLLKNINDSIIKFCVDIIIFVVNYIVQKKVVFK